MGGAERLQALLYARVSDLPDASSMTVALASIQLWLEGIVGILLLLGAFLMILGREKIGVSLGSIGLVISLVGVNLINFYIDQFGAIAKAFIEDLLLYFVYYYQGRFTQR